MAVTAHAYTKLGTSLASKLGNLGSDALKVMLLTAYTPGQDTHQFVNDVKGAGTEVSAGGGYSLGGVALSGVSLSAPSGHVVTLNASNASWATATISAAFAVFYDSTPGTDATNPVIAYWDFGGTLASTAGTFQLTLTSGIITLTGS